MSCRTSWAYQNHIRFLERPNRGAGGVIFIGWQMVTYVCAVGFSEGLHAHPGAFWDTLVPRDPD